MLISDDKKRYMDKGTNEKVYVLAILCNVTAPVQEQAKCNIYVLVQE